MKRHLILFLAAVLLCGTAGAQSTFEKLFEKYTGPKYEPYTTSVYLSKSMLNLGIQVAGAEDLNLNALQGKLESLIILTTEASGVRVAMRKDFGSIDLSGYEVLMKVRDGGDRVDFLVRREKENPELIREFLMIADENGNEGQYTVIRLLGNGIAQTEAEGLIKSMDL